MKKIVALALSLVMALALCTTAFAATTTNSLTAKDYTLLVNNTTSVKLEKIEKTVQDSTSVTALDGTVTVTYYADKYVIDAEDNTLDGTYYAVDATVGYDVKLVSGGKVVAFLMENDAPISTPNVVTACTKTTVAQADAKCGELNVAKGTVVYTIDGKKYGVGDTWAYFNGSFVKVNMTDVLPVVGHDFDLTKVNADKGTFTSVYCKNCKSYIPVVKTADIAATDAGVYVAIDGLPGGYSYLKTAAGTTTTTDKTTTSPKTFDAGIAMYVGMSLMSVAGSAVVIGKKKEF